MSLPRAASVVAVLLCLLFCVSSAQQAPCATPLLTTHFDNSSYHSTYTFYSHAITLTTEILNQPQTVYSLGLQLAPFGDPTRPLYNLRLALYVQRNTTLFVRLAQTANIEVTGAQAAAGMDLYGALQSPVSVTAGTYFVAKVVDETGLQVYGDGLFDQPGQDMFYDETINFPNLVMRSFAAVAVRAAIVGCLPDAGAVGDPTFYGFKGQVYQVHGIAGYVFNLLTSAELQVNSRFDFIDTATSITQGEQSNLRRTHATLPNTPAWSHPGTYLGQTGIRLGSSAIDIVPGAYLSGFAHVTVNGQALDMASLAYPAVVLSASNVLVTLVSPSVLRVVTALLRFDVVNSDGFINIQRAQLLSTATAAAQQVDGILGQSADGSRYFPAYGDVDASADVRGEWQQAQIHDFLIVDDDIFSTDFGRNKFVVSA